MKRLILVALVCALAACGGKSSPTEPNSPAVTFTTLAVWCDIYTAQAGHYWVSGATVHVIGTGFDVTATTDNNGLARVPPFPANTPIQLTAIKPTVGGWAGQFAGFPAGAQSTTVTLQ